MSTPTVHCTHQNIYISVSKTTTAWHICWLWTSFISFQTLTSLWQQLPLTHTHHWCREVLYLRCSLQNGGSPAVEGGGVGCLCCHRQGVQSNSKKETKGNCAQCCGRHSLDWRAMNRKCLKRFRNTVNGRGEVGGVTENKTVRIKHSCSPIHPPPSSCEHPLYLQPETHKRKIDHWITLLVQQKDTHSHLTPLSSSQAFQLSLVECIMTVYIQNFKYRIPKHLPNRDHFPKPSYCPDTEFEHFPTVR